MSVTHNIRIGRPNKEAQTLDKGAIVGAVTSDELMVRRDAEMLPSHTNHARGIGGIRVPERVDDDLADVVEHANAFNVATLIVLADVDVR